MKKMRTPMMIAATTPPPTAPPITAPLVDPLSEFGVVDDVADGT